MTRLSVLAVMTMILQLLFLYVTYTKVYVAPFLKSMKFRNLIFIQKSLIAAIKSLFCLTVSNGLLHSICQVKM